MSTGTRIGLACAGGVVEGAFYEIGVLGALQQAIEGLDLNHLDVYVGVSAGAIVTSCLANGITPDMMRRVVLGQEREDLNLRPEVLFRPAVREYAKRALQLPFATYRALENYLVRPRDISLFGALMRLGRALPVGLFDNTPLERYLEYVFSTHGRSNSFGDLPSKLRLLAVNLDTSLLVAFGEPETAHVPIARAVRASAALPILYCPVEIDGEYYIDGIARRTLNASEALSEGADLLFCINPIVPVDLGPAARAGTHREHASLVDLGLPAVLSQTFRTMIHSRMRTGFRNYEYAYPDADILLIEPVLSDQTMFFSNIFSFSNRYRVCEYGYQTARQWLVTNAGRIEPMLRRHGLALRWSVLAEEDSRFVPPDELARVLPEVRRAAETVDDAWASVDRLERVIESLSAALGEPIPVAEGGEP